MTSTPVPFFAGPHYLVTADGTHCYPVNRSAIVTRNGGFGYTTTLVLPDGVRTVDQKLGGSYSDPTVTWVVSPGPLGEIVVKGRDSSELVGYVLKDPDAASEKYPARLTPAEWSERDYGDEDSEDGYLATRIYREEKRAVPGEDVHYSTADLTRLDGSVDEFSDRSWTADQPMALVYSNNYHHLFPGRMYGVRQAVLDALVAEFGRMAVRTWDHLPDDPIEVRLQISFETPQWRTVSQTGRNGRKLKATTKVPVVENITLKVPLSRASYVVGSTKAEAAATRDRIVAEWVEWAKSYRVVACDHCNGTGVARTQGPRPGGEK